MTKPARVAQVCSVLALLTKGYSHLSSHFVTEDGVKLCPSPGGYHPCDCLHEIDSHSRVDEVKNPDGSRKAIVNFPNGTTMELPQCPHKRPSPPHRRGRPGTTGFNNTCQLGWAHATPMEAFYQHSKNIQKYTATYTVPDPPTTVSGNVLYYWIGLQDLYSSENPVIQPVLSWLEGSSPNNWYFESWNCCPAGHKLKATSVPIEGEGATVYGSMEKDSNGLFTINSQDSTGQTSVLYSNDTLSGIVAQWDWVEIVLETYSINSCSEYSAGGQAKFLDMTLIDTDGQSVTPSFTMNPYINGQYLSPAESAQFTACCNGEFNINWPNAAMQQNGASSSGDVVV